MKRKIFLAVLLFAGSTHAGNFASCLLDRLPGVVNAPAAHAVYRLCVSEYPAAYAGVVKGVGRRAFFSYSNSEECIVKKGKDTSQPSAAAMIAAACRCLYDTSLDGGPGESCDPAAATQAAPQAAPVTDRSQTPELKAHYQAIFRVHPDALTIYESPGFQAWLAKQTDTMRAALATGSTTDVIAVFSAYKASR